MSEKVYFCPSCKKKKLYINLSKKVGWCHVCSKALSPSQTREFLGVGSSTDSRVLVSTIPKLISAWSDSNARRFLKSRFVGEHDCPNVGYDPEERRLYFKIWSPSPELPYSFHTRGIGEGGKWRLVSGTAKSGYLYGGVINRSAVVVEGVWDAIRIGSGALAILGTNLSTTHEVYLRREVSRVLVYMDPDEAGQKAQKEILSRLKKIGVKCAAMVGADKEPADYPPGHPVLAAVQDWLRKD